jgi:hypothetical protein
MVTGHDQAASSTPHSLIMQGFFFAGVLDYDSPVRVERQRSTITADHLVAFEIDNPNADTLCLYENPALAVRFDKLVILRVPFSKPLPSYYPR